MKILALNWRDIRSPDAGGSESHLHEILRRLVMRGHDVTLACSWFPEVAGPCEEFVDGIHTHRVGRWWNAHRSIPRMARQLMRAKCFDVLLDDVSKIPFFSPEFSTIPTVALFLHLLGETAYLETNPLFAAAVRRYERRIGQVYRVTPSVAISASTKNELVREGLDPKRIEIIEPGVDTSVYRPRSVPIDLAPLVVLVSRLKRYKRVDVAIKAMPHVHAAIPGARLIVIGDGGERRSLESLAISLRAPVTFLGRVSEAEKVSWLNRARVFVSASMKEGWGLACVEALACGTPVVASDVEGHRDSVPASAGVLVPHGDVRATATALIDVMSDAHARASLGLRGVAWAKQHSWDAVADRLQDVLLQAAGQLREKERAA